VTNNEPSLPFLISRLPSHQSMEKGREGVPQCKRHHPL
jgi:hypothetical protein